MGRARLREAASELFAEHGFAATSTRSTAAAAGLSPALVTRHFGSTQGQRAAVDEYVLDRIGEQLRDLDSMEPGRGPMVSLGEVSAPPGSRRGSGAAWLPAPCPAGGQRGERGTRRPPPARRPRRDGAAVRGPRGAGARRGGGAAPDALPDPWAVAAGAGGAAQPGRADVLPRGAGPPQRGQPTAPAAGLLRSAGLRRWPGLRRVL
ncbi:TetR/AcrR family transcriptional regulator [Streptomyces mirabilis]|uniref:TetR/AcrR family transcriptional regulator n=1 Tax=Streptomyces mirabilis TaxID=68239 RepID=UPI0036BB4F09